jgi:alkanesulfonate monooxygenase SsuD/methylene tetrahydromethanopterin reductase-like flavin-dependent oxidoreductase (luciferase family)
MKKIGFLSFGHWTPSPQSQTRSAADTLLQSIELAVAAEELGADGAYFRVHHFARQLASPFPPRGGRGQDQPDRDRDGRDRELAGLAIDPSPFSGRIAALGAEAPAWQALVADSLLLDLTSAIKNGRERTGDA